MDGATPGVNVIVVTGGTVAFVTLVALVTLYAAERQYENNTTAARQMTGTAY